MKMKRENTGERKGGGACNHSFKRLVLVYQLKVYPLIGQIDTLHQQFLMRVVSITQRGGVRRLRA